MGGRFDFAFLSNLMEIRERFLTAFRALLRTPLLDDRTADFPPTLARSDFLLPFGCEYVVDAIKVTMINERKDRLILGVNMSSSSSGPYSIERPRTVRRRKVCGAIANGSYQLLFQSWLKLICRVLEIAFLLARHRLRSGLNR